MTKEAQEVFDRYDTPEVRERGREYLARHGNKNPSREEEILHGMLFDVLGDPDKASQRVGRTLAQIQKDFNVQLPQETLKAYGMEEKFKMTFANSWWQCLIALLLYVPTVKAIAVVTTVILGAIGLSGAELAADIESFGYVVSIPLMYYLARHLSYQSWKRRITKNNIPVHK